MTVQPHVLDQDAKNRLAALADQIIGPGVARTSAAAFERIAADSGLRPELTHPILRGLIDAGYIEINSSDTTELAIKNQERGI